MLTPEQVQKAWAEGKRTAREMDPALDRWCRQIELRAIIGGGAIVLSLVGLALVFLLAR